MTTTTTTTTNKAGAEILAQWRGKGDYGAIRVSRLVRKGEKHYLIHDGWCGRGSVRGETYRPFVYEIPAALVDRACDLIANGDESSYDEEYRGYASKIQELEHEILTDGRVRDFGGQGSLAWTSAL